MRLRLWVNNLVYCCCSGPDIESVTHTSLIAHQFSFLLDLLHLIGQHANLRSMLIHTAYQYPFRTVGLRYTRTQRFYLLWNRLITAKAVISFLSFARFVSRIHQFRLFFVHETALIITHVVRFALPFFNLVFFKLWCILAEIGIVRIEILHLAFWFFAHFFLACR